MEEDQDESARRHRSPSFDKEEVKVLLDLVDKFKEFILNKSTTFSASRAKELAWLKITNKFNSHGFKNVRTVGGLKYKWRNLLNYVKKQSKNLLDASQDEFDEFSSQVLSLIHDEDIHISEVVLPADLEEVYKDIEQQKQSNNQKKIYWDENSHRETEDYSDYDGKITRKSMNSSTQGSNPDTYCDYNNAMEEDQDDSARRHRSPSFDKEEVKVLLDLVNEFKEYILNKSTTFSASRAKDLAWVKITNKFNSHGFKNVRTVDGLKHKWRNLLNYVKKQSKNLLDASQDEFDEFSSQVLSLINDEDIHISDVVLPSDFEEVVKELEQRKHSNNDKNNCWDNNSHREPEDSSGDDVKFIRNRSMNFTSLECRLLLKCVQAERKYIFCKDLSSKARHMKNAAWARITAEYNRENCESRSTKVLQRKFLNMKHLTKKACRKNIYKNKRKCNELFDENYTKVKEIKCEPLFEVEDEHLNGNVDKSDSDDDFDSDANRDPKLEDPDPLSTVLNNDSGLGSSVNLGSFNPFENNEVVKLKIELLKYKIDNAKMEKTRIENAMREDAKTQELIGVERALRLRAARLQVAAAETGLPAGHPALVYTEEELAAQAYLKRYQT